MPKTPKVEYDRRILAIQGWLIEGSPYALILKSILDQEWCTSKRQAERMIKDARDRWLPFEEDRLDAKRKFKVQQLQHKIRSMDPAYKKTPQGLQVALNYEKEIIALEGLKGAQKIEISGDEEKPVQVKHVRSNIDYSKLSDEVLHAIVAARKTQRSGDED